MRSSRGKAPLRMTGVVLNEILTASKNEASGWPIKNTLPAERRHPSKEGARGSIGRKRRGGEGARNEKKDDI